MAPIEINKEKLVTEKDVFQHEDGSFSVTVEIPSSGESFQITGSNAQHLLSSANDMILHDLKRQQAEGPYRAGVQALSEMCLSQSGSGAHAAAQVLLSCYNNAFHVDLTDLCNLDDNYFTHAMAVINGRVLCSKEPHSMIEDGSDIFDRIWKQWNHLHSKVRYKEWYE